MFKTKTSRSLVLLGSSAVIGIGSLWAWTGRLQTSVLFYGLSSAVLGSALLGLKIANNWINWVSEGEE